MIQFPSTLSNSDFKGHRAKMKMLKDEIVSKLKSAQDRGEVLSYKALYDQLQEYDQPMIRTALAGLLEDGHIRFDIHQRVILSPTQIYPTSGLSDV